MYIATVKALAAEMTANFGNKLQPLGIVVRELTGDMQLTKKEIQETQVQCKGSMSSAQTMNFYLNFPGRLAQLLVVFPANKYVLTVSNRMTRKMWEICSKLTIKTHF